MPFSPYISKALDALGFQRIAGANSGKLMGYTEITASLDPAAETRSSSETSFLQKAMAETTIQVYQSTLADKILFNGSTAVGVQVTSSGSTYVLSATKEVIVSAGVVSSMEIEHLLISSTISYPTCILQFRSPQLLMLSGIGPADILRALSIPVLVDLPGVGQNIIVRYPAMRHVRVPGC
jgi:choline dehydrogenase